MPLTVHSDCLAGIFSANKRRCRDWTRGVFLGEYALPQRRRILSAARPVLNGIRAVVRCRTAPTHLEFVRAHTGASNQHAIMNQLADEEANRVRREYARSPRLPLRLYGEEGHPVALKDIPVIGAFKSAILRCMSARSVSRWCGIPSKYPVVGADLPPLAPDVAHSARLVSAHRDAVLAMSDTVSQWHPRSPAPTVLAAGCDRVASGGASPGQKLPGRGAPSGPWLQAVRCSG